MDIRAFPIHPVLSHYQLTLSAVLNHSRKWFAVLNVIAPSDSWVGLSCMHCRSVMFRSILVGSFCISPSMGGLSCRFLPMSAFVSEPFEWWFSPIFVPISATNQIAIVPKSNPWSLARILTSTQLQIHVCQGPNYIHRWRRFPLRSNAALCRLPQQIPFTMSYIHDINNTLESTNLIIHLSWSSNNI